jgi:hypothetical protein
LPQHQQPRTQLSSPLPSLFPPARTHWTSVVQPKSRHHRPEASLRPCRHSKVPEPSLQVTNLPMPPISPFMPLCVRNCSLEWSCAVAEPLCHGPPPSSASAPVSCPWLCLPHHPRAHLSPFQRPRTPGVPAPSPPAGLQHEVGRRRRWQPGRPCSGLSWDLERPSEIKRPRFNYGKSNLSAWDLSPRIRSLTRAPAAGPDRSAYLALKPLTSLSRVSALAHTSP